MSEFNDLVSLALHDLKLKGVRYVGRVRITREALYLAGVSPALVYRMTEKLPFKLELGQKLREVCASDVEYYFDKAEQIMNKK